jgi:hypothetical protein
MGEVAIASTDWIGLGDRSHPNLKVVDELKLELTYDGHENDLRKLEQAHFSGCGFGNILHRVRETEKMSKGDRSHPNLVRLDKLIKKVTYDGWRVDFHEAEKQHLNAPLFFDYMVKQIERKQKLSVGDRSDIDVKFLDSLRLSFPGWERHWQEALDYYIRGHDMKNIGTRFCLTERQRMYEGDRSHPRLVALDSLRLTYPGWKKDVHKYEQRHVGLGFNGFEMFGESAARREIVMLKCKQERYCFGGVKDSSWMDPDQRTIVNTQWTFPGWKEEVQMVRERTIQNFGDKLEHFQLRQMMHDGDYSHHPLLIKLNSIQLSYPGWEKDIESSKRELQRTCMWKDTLETNIQGMLKKQNVYNGYLRSMIRDTYEGKESKSTMGECIVCWEVPRTHVFVPCGHVCACQSCSSRVMNSEKRCPVCNQSSTMSIEVFVP